MNVAKVITVYILKARRILGTVLFVVVVVVMLQLWVGYWLNQSPI